MGALPQGKHLQKIERSPHYKNGQFQNLSPTPQLAPGVSYFKVFRGALLTKHPGKLPNKPLHLLHQKWQPYAGLQPKLTWFGHSSYLIQVAGKNILVDPVFGQRASFTAHIGPAAFKTDLPFTLNELPPIHYLILTHDHYDHLDCAVIQALKETVETVYAPLGVGAHLQHWGLSAQKIIELDWWDKTEVGHNMELIATPARHFSGRGIKRNKSLWAAYVLRSPQFVIYLGGDSGYDTHFKTIGEKYGPFDIAILECGQYNKWWPFIHMQPEETVQATQDLGAKMLLPVHWGRFPLAMHTWQEPAQRVVKSARKKGMPITMPQLGEPLIVNEHYPFTEWWEHGVTV